MSELRELDQQVAQSLMGWVWYNAHGRSMLVPRSLPESFDMRWMREHIADHPTHRKKILTGLDFRGGISLPHYSDEIAAAFQVEDRIKELGLEEEYGERLSEEIHRQSNGKHGIFYGSEVFDIAHASAELRCRAALECVKEKAKAAGG